MVANKTDANDADGLAHRAEVGFYRDVRVKGFDSMLTRTLGAARPSPCPLQVRQSGRHLRRSPEQLHQHLNAPIGRSSDDGGG
jgi:hypothetical protein